MTLCPLPQLLPSPTPPCKRVASAIRGRWGPLARRRIDAVERDAGPNQVAMGATTQEYAGRICKRGRDATIEDANFAKQPNLPIIHRVVGNLSAGEVAHH